MYINEIKRGTVALYNGNVMRYKAKAGQDAYEKNVKRAAVTICFWSVMTS